MSRASVLLRSDQVLGALDALLKAERIADAYEAEFYQIHNLKGAAWRRVGDLEHAQKEFESAIEIDPEGFRPGYNLAEVLFIRANWKAAHSRYSILMDEFGVADEVGAWQMNKATERLIWLRILICRLKLGRLSEALRLMRKVHHLDDVPDFYLGNAAIEFSSGNPNEATMWIGSAKRIYGKNAVKKALEVFVEAGWLEHPSSAEEGLVL
jgi:tetratricopeptide (TPR) repeat protein